MRKGGAILKKAGKALGDWNLLKVLQSEIKVELSSPFPFQEIEHRGSVGDFVVDWDAPQSQDVVLRKKCGSGEEVAVSAMLGHHNSNQDSLFSQTVLMKVCVKKPSLSSILQFDCEVVEKYSGGSWLDIREAFYFQSSSCPGPSAYRGPPFWTLDHGLQDALKEYIASKGIDENLTNFLLLHLHTKEQAQYLKWLQKLESLVAEGES